MEEYFALSLWIWMGISLIPLVLLQFIKAPYGRYSKGKGWGPLISNRTGWVLMELPALLVYPLIVLFSPLAMNACHFLFLGLWGLHYINRTLIFPFRTRTRGKKMPISIPLMAMFFNSMNGFFLGYGIAYMFPGQYDLAWLSHPQSMVGIALFLCGFLINIDSDNRLLNLRKPGETGYKIPWGGLYKWVSCPNYFGEILEWSGYAILLWNLPAVSFLIWTIANLLPRAISHHSWYKGHFADYPPKRKALIPYLF